MKARRIRSLMVPALACALAATTTQAQTTDTRIGTLDFERGVPTKASVAKLFDEMDFQRACQAYLWALPLVGFGQLGVILEQVSGAGPGDVTTFQGYRNVSAFLTPNVTTSYTVGGLDLAKTGPAVVDVPGGLLAGSAMDLWQRPLTDIGLTGPDQGKGGKYVFVGPGQEAPAVEGGVVLRSPTFTVLYFYRALDTDPAKAEALEKGVRAYPWAQRDVAAGAAPLAPC